MQLKPVWHHGSSFLGCILTCSLTWHLRLAARWMDGRVWCSSSCRPPAASLRRKSVRHQVTSDGLTVHSSIFQRLKICFPDKKCFLSVRAAQSSPVHQSCCSISTLMWLTCREDSRAERRKRNTSVFTQLMRDDQKQRRYDCWVFYSSSDLQLINRSAFKSSTFIS